MYYVSVIQFFVHGAVCTVLGYLAGMCHYNTADASQAHIDNTQKVISVV